MSLQRRTLFIISPSAATDLRLDYEVREATSAEAVRKGLREHRTALVLLDPAAPGEAGLALCRELLASSKASHPAASTATDERSQLKFGDIEFDAKGEGLHIETPTGKVPVSLTHHEFRLLLCLARAGGKILSRDHLIKTVWSTDTRIIGRTVDTHVCKLRKKISASRFTIHSVYGAGYRFFEPSG